MATRQSSRNSAATQPAACPTSKIDRGPREERPVVPLSILRTHWIKERRLCAVKAYLIATHSDAPAIRARHQTGMQSHGGPQLVAELPQSLKNATASKYFGLSNVRYGSLADISERTRDVRFTPESGHAERQHQCPLSANSRHWDCWGTGYEYRRMACAAHIGSPRISLIKPNPSYLLAMLYLTPTTSRSALKTCAPTPVRRSSTRRRALKTYMRACPFE